MRLTLLGTGAMNSPRCPPAALLVAWRGWRVMFDGGPGAEPDRHVHVWLVTDARSELIRGIRKLADAHGVRPAVESRVFVRGSEVLRAEPRAVAHTSHPAYGYLIEAGGRRVVWAPEFWEFPAWAAGADLMFADAAGWDRPIRFAGGVGGHAEVLATARHAREHGVARLVFAHIGRPAIRAIDAGLTPPFGEWGHTGRNYHLPRQSSDG
ncbi:MBL fold metallo-hydrolase [Amycolatopsis anabasis]|uniref:MBL fold metallo-hydrolase n=1 Tax=Amycolatopsis anabasis TaxID=1840409 RepID=UPI00131D0164|nr:MBL fold metallo-hydrolase [Amycolatopsis anabasis]